MALRREVDPHLLTGLHRELAVDVVRWWYIMRPVLPQPALHLSDFDRAHQARRQSAPNYRQDSGDCPDLC